MWFIVHKTHADRYTYTDSQELDGPVFRNHPNRNDLISEFLCIRLSAKELCIYQENIRLISYQWRDEKTGVSDGGSNDGGDVQDHRFPANYVWFLELLKENGIIGWVDFMSNSCVRVDVSITISYMGSLYVYLPVCAEWIVNPLLISSAMERGWIFQESTFGRFDPLLISDLATYLSHWREQGIDTTQFLQLCLELSYLLERRGYDKIFEANNPEIDDFWEGGYLYGKTAVAFEHLEPDAGDIFNRIKHTGEEDVSFTVKHMLEHCILDSEEELRAWLSGNLCRGAIDTASNAEEFCKLYSKGMVKAFLSSKLTYEIDRQTAITSVASSILRTYGASLSPEEIMLKCWQYFIYQCQKFAEVWSFVIRSSIPGQKLAFLRDIEGTLEPDMSVIWSLWNPEYREQMVTLYTELGVTKFFHVTTSSIDSSGSALFIGLDDAGNPCFFTTGECSYEQMRNSSFDDNPEPEEETGLCCLLDCCCFRGETVPKVERIQWKVA